MNIISVSTKSIWEKAVWKLINRLEGARKKEKRSLLLLSGGSAVNIYQKLAEYIKKSQFGSENLTVGQIDERFRPENSGDINASAIEKSGLTEVLGKKKIPFYEIPQTGSLSEVSDYYDKILRRLFIKADYEIAVLGIGRDGHTAGLLPGYRERWEKDRLAAGYEKKGEFRQRITLTPRALVQLDYALVAVSGEEKREVLGKILEKKTTNINLLPGILIHRIKEADVVNDMGFSS